MVFPVLFNADLFSRFFQESPLFKPVRTLTGKPVVDLSLKIDFVLATTPEPDEMPRNIYMAFHLGLHCLQKYPSCQNGLKYFNTVILECE